ncbi:hypothetical protein GMRT_13072 [Giardia muris]|uniref:Uncharacterized protein n=1 Tax=Giardia muris TaxID=5742 RepID=A0A4Z1SXY0_GIAMU|nr:hypothetical protein GMRT_13072 [Giardia muris]|eukprot:TNJ30370.1 hypothetical protein GMRT_13072 [Giardia muris]
MASVPRRTRDIPDFTTRLNGRPASYRAENDPHLKEFFARRNLRYIESKARARRGPSGPSHEKNGAQKASAQRKEAMLRTYLDKSLSQHPYNIEPSPQHSAPAKSDTATAYRTRQPDLFGTQDTDPMCASRVQNAVSSFNRLWEALEIPLAERNYAYALLYNNPALLTPYQKRLTHLMHLRRMFRAFLQERISCKRALLDMLSEGRGSRKVLAENLSKLRLLTICMSSLANEARLICDKPICMPYVRISTEYEDSWFLFLKNECIYSRKNTALIFAILRFFPELTLAEVQQVVDNFFNRCISCNDDDDTFNIRRNGEDDGNTDGDCALELTEADVSLYFLLGLQADAVFQGDDLPVCWNAHLHTLKGCITEICDIQVPLLTPSQILEAILGEEETLQEFQAVVEYTLDQEKMLVVVPVFPPSDQWEAYYLDIDSFNNYQGSLRQYAKLLHDASPEAEQSPLADRVDKREALETTAKPIVRPDGDVLLPGPLKPLGGDFTRDVATEPDEEPPQHASNVSPEARSVEPEETNTYEAQGEPTYELPEEETSLCRVRSPEESSQLEFPLPPEGLPNVPIHEFNWEEEVGGPSCDSCVTDDEHYGDEQFDDEDGPFDEPADVRPTSDLFDELERVFTPVYTNDLLMSVHEYDIAECRDSNPPDGEILPAVIIREEVLHEVAPEPEPKEANHELTFETYDTVTKEEIVTVEVRTVEEVREVREENLSRAATPEEIPSPVEVRTVEEVREVREENLSRAATPEEIPSPVEVRTVEEVREVREENLSRAATPEEIPSPVEVRTVEEVREVREENLSRAATPEEIPSPVEVRTVEEVREVREENLSRAATPPEVVSQSEESIEKLKDEDERSDEIPEDDFEEDIPDQENNMSENAVEVDTKDDDDYIPPADSSEGHQEGVRLDHLSSEDGSENDSPTRTVEPAIFKSANFVDEEEDAIEIALQ